MNTSFACSMSSLDSSTQQHMSMLVETAQRVHLKNDTIEGDIQWFRKLIKTQTYFSFE